MKFSNKALSQTVTQLCLAKEVDHIVISPGSRNAPLTIGFTSHPGFTCYSIVDERCAAFFALGMAQQLKRPVALVCTSGSALLNYYPAVAEAFYSEVPLVVISADRPEELIDVGDGQTIRQENVYKNHILYSANCREGEEHQLSNEKEINIALNSAIELSGPVHLNVPFTEPLYETQVDLSVRPQHVPARSVPASLNEDISEVLSDWQKSTRKMLLIGTLPSDTLSKELIEALAADENLVVLTETTSNLHHANFFPAIDQLIAPLDEAGFEQLQPDILLTMGGMVVSKKIKAFLRAHKPREHWHVDERRAYDTYFCLSHHFKTTPGVFLSEFLKVKNAEPGSYRSDWLRVRDRRRSQQKAFEAGVRYSDFKVYSEVFRLLRSSMQLHLSNSTAIRYSQLFEVHKELEVFCNRGTSGIDGSTSTALGAAVVTGKPTLLITGDLSFFYDSNALWNAHVPKNFKILIVNNSGGGIFRILPGAKETDHFNRFFETVHGLTAEHLSVMFGFAYTSCHTEDELTQHLKAFFAATGPTILEIFTPPAENDLVLQEYFDAIK